MRGNFEIRLFESEAEKELTARRVLEALPEWFGIPEAREEYIKNSAAKPFLAALDGEKTVGFLYLNETGNATVELHCMGVLKEYHRSGIGRELVENAKQLASEMGYAFMQVKTVQSGFYEEYDRTNEFYRACGFLEFEVIPELWGEKNPCQIYVLHLGGA